MPIKITDLKELPEDQCYILSSNTSLAVESFLQEHKGTAYLGEEVAEALNNTQQKLNITTLGKVSKQKIRTALSKLAKQTLSNIQRKGSYYWYEEPKDKT